MFTIGDALNHKAGTQQTLTLGQAINNMPAIVAEAEKAAGIAAVAYLSKYYGGNDNYPCGFAWANICSFDGKKIRGNSKLGKALKQNGITQDYNRTFQVWNPSGLAVQNVDTKEIGAMAFAAVFKKYGFEASAGSRLD